MRTLSGYLMLKKLVVGEKKKVKIEKPTNRQPPPCFSSEMPMPLFVLHN